MTAKTPHLLLTLLAAFILSTACSVRTHAYSIEFFSPYVQKVKGFDNRLTLDNILKLSSLPPDQARELLIKAGWSIDKKNNTLLKKDHYADNPQPILYKTAFEGVPKGFRQIIIYTQPEMRMIDASLRAGGYSVTRVIPRKGARWTKIYKKKGFPTYSISMLLSNDMNERALNYEYYDYIYSLICEENN